MFSNSIFAMISCFLTGCSDGEPLSPSPGVGPAPASTISCALELRPTGRSLAYVAQIRATGAGGLTGKASLSVRSPGVEIDDRRPVSVAPNGRQEVQFAPLPLTGAAPEAHLTVTGADGAIRCETTG